MTIAVNPTTAAIEAWAVYLVQAGTVKRPVTEEDYNALHALADDLSSRYNLNQEPYGSLFDHIMRFMHDWEVLNQPELKGFEKPHVLLAELMEERKVSQSQLAREIGVSQGNLSRVLRGEREIGKELAHKLALYFDVPRAEFL